MSQGDLPEKDNLDLPMDELDFSEMSEENLASDEPAGLDTESPDLTDFGDLDTSGEEPESFVPAGVPSDVPSEKGKKSKKSGKKDKKKSTDGEPLTEKILNASPYVVMLALSMAAILVALLFLFLELKAYDYDIKANAGKGRVVFVSPPPIQSTSMFS